MSDIDTGLGALSGTAINSAMTDQEHNQKAHSSSSSDINIDDYETVDVDQFSQLTNNSNPPPFPLTTEAVLKSSDVLEEFQTKIGGIPDKTSGVVDDFLSSNPLTTPSSMSDDLDPFGKDSTVISSDKMMDFFSEIPSTGADVKIDTVSSDPFTMDSFTGMTSAPPIPDINFGEANDDLLGALSSKVDNFGSTKSDNFSISSEPKATDFTKDIFMSPSLTEDPITPPREPSPLMMKEQSPAVVESVAAPKTPSPPPKEPTPPPKEPTPLPKEPTPPPKEPTPPPREPTPPPRKPTPPPKVPTPPPKEPTPPPKLQTPSPKVSVQELVKAPIQEAVVSSGARPSPYTAKTLAILDPLVELIYWRDVKKSGIVFGSVMIVLLSLAYLSLISVAAYTSLTLLTGTICFRIYKNVMQAIQKSQDGHPFKSIIEMDTKVSEDKALDIARVLIGQVNCLVSELKRLFLVEDLVDSVKFGCLLWCLTYLGSWFNGLTLVILAVVALFSLPKVYEQNQGQIDQYVGLARSQVNDVMTKVKAALPIGSKEKTQ